MFVAGLSKQVAVPFMVRRLAQLHKSDLRGYKTLGVAKAFPKGESLKNTAGLNALDALVKNPGNRTKALLEAARSDKKSAGPTPSKAIAEVLNNQLLANNPFAAALMTAKAASKVKRDVFKNFQMHFENEVGKNRDRGRDALRQSESDLKEVMPRVLELLQHDRYKDLPEAKTFVRELGKLENFQEDLIDHYLEMLDKEHPFGRAAPAPAHSNDAKSDHELEHCARKIYSSLAKVTDARYDMQEAAVFRDIYAALRETQRNWCYRWIAARISPEMRGHLAAAFGIFGAVVMIASVPLMVGPLKDWCADLFHHHSNQQQQQQGQ